jgi:arabinoxylan arabinofuranohydrolase
MHRLKITDRINRLTMIRLTFFLMCCAACNLCLAQNPFITHMYTADPSARVFNDTLYVYPSHDEDTATRFSMKDWHVFSTTDMKNWTDHGVALSLNDLSWAHSEAWAPDCAKRNGKYYFYYPVEASEIGVAVGDKPYGPFKDPLDFATVISLIRVCLLMMTVRHICIWVSL